MTTDQDKTHGVLTDAEIHDLGLVAMQAGWPNAEFARAIEAAVLAKAAPQPAVAPAPQAPPHLGTRTVANGRTMLSPREKSPMGDIKLPDLPAPHAVHSHAVEAQVYTPAMMLAYARAAILADRTVRVGPSEGNSASPIAFRSSYSVSPSFDRGEHQIQERQIALAERMGVKADLYRVDMGVLGEIYVKPEVASDRFKQLKRDRAPVKAVYPMYQGAALPNKVDAINPAGAPHP